MPTTPWPADHVERRPVAALIPYARNARVHTPAQVAQIAASIQQFGWTMPVLADETGNLIAGHARVMAAQHIGLEDVPVMVAHGWTEAQKRAYVIADNKLSLNSAWDESLLRLEMSDLKLEGFDLGLTGFSDLELKGMLNDATAPEQFPSYDETIEVEHQCPRCGYSWSGGIVARPKINGAEE